MNNIKIKPGHLIFLFLAWFASMFLPSTLNRVKFSETLSLEQVYENFFYLLFHQEMAVGLALLLLLSLAFFLSFKKKKRDTFHSSSLSHLICLLLHYILPPSYGH